MSHSTPRISDTFKEADYSPLLSLLKIYDIIYRKLHQSYKSYTPALPSTGVSERQHTYFTTLENQELFGATCQKLILAVSHISIPHNTSNICVTSLNQLLM